MLYVEFWVISDFFIFVVVIGTLWVDLGGFGSNYAHIPENVLETCNCQHTLFRLKFRNLY